MKHKNQVCMHCGAYDEPCDCYDICKCGKINAECICDTGPLNKHGQPMETCSSAERMVKCQRSSNIAGQLTFGCGRVDDLGFFEYPCQACARKHEEEYPEDGQCWPLPNANICPLCGRMHGSDVNCLEEKNYWNEIIDELK